jgi:D-xylose transport system permease protein
LAGAGAGEVVTTAATDPTTVPPEFAETGREGNGVGAHLGRWWDNVRAGDVGSLPIIVGLLLITVFFQTKNDNFLTAGNVSNLIGQMAGTATIAMGVVFVLLLGEIDLSIGFVSGIAGVVVAELQTGGNWTELPGWIAIVLAVLACAAIGLLEGSFVAFVGVPSFIVTLAFLLALQGVIQKLIGVTGVIVIQDQTIFDFANYTLPDSWGWISAAVLIALYLASTLSGVISRRRHGIISDNLVLVTIKCVVVVGAIVWMIYWLNDKARGFPFVGLVVIVLLVFLTWVATRTRFGRHVYAVGGNAEAARRAGINVRMIRWWVFGISGAMAGLGGVIFASRLSSVDLNAGSGTILLDAIAAAVIGGTSLFGGRGEVKSALLGALIIASIANGMSLLGYSSATQYIVTGIILLAAVTLDTISRRRLAASGR